MVLAMFGQVVDMGHRVEPPVRRKPEVQVLRLNGKVRVIGVKEAAIYLGISQTVVRDIAMGPEKSARYSAALRTRVLKEYPQLKGE
jgi:hypothetical protein